MNLWKRAYLHTIRKKGKTVFMFSILLIIATLILTCLAIRSTANIAALNIRKSLMGSFTINAKHIDTQIKDSLVTDILNTHGLASNYNLRSYYQAEYRSIDEQLLDITVDGAIEVPAGYEHVGKIVSNTHSESDTYFTKAGFKLVQGQHITTGHNNVILIHEKFAQRNNLSIGDHFLLTIIGQAHSYVDVEIIGIFTNTIPQDAYGMAPSYDLYENISFSDNRTYSQLFFTDEMEHYQYGDFFVDDPAELDTIISMVKSISDMNWNDCIFSKHDKDYQNAKDVLTSLQKLIITITYVLIIIGIVLLALILSFWIKNRVYEAGVLLAMGFNKRNILMQYITEILMIAFLAFALSFSTSTYITQSVGNNLLQQVATESKATVVNITEQRIQEKTMGNSFSLDAIDIHVSLLDLLMIYIIGTGIILLSILVATYPIMKMKPKEILTKTS